MSMCVVCFVLVGAIRTKLYGLPPAFTAYAIKLLENQSLEANRYKLYEI